MLFDQLTKYYKNKKHFIAISDINIDDLHLKSSINQSIDHLYFLSFLNIPKLLSFYY